MLAFFAAAGLLLAALVLIGAPARTTDSALRVEASDTGTRRSPLAFWGSVDCARPRDRGLTPAHQRIATGGDTHPPEGADTPGDTSFRRLTVYDGDDVSGERCELGLNDNPHGPTVFYGEGERYVTYASLRLPEALDVDDPDWRVVLQMKQTQPYTNPRQASIFELQVRSGRWLALSDNRTIWSAPAEAGVWTRFRFDITYSQDPSMGSVQISVDLNGDGDYDDGALGEESELLRLQTLVPETLGGTASGLAAGESVPSHLRAGIYQNESYACPRSGVGCSVDVDNVQVLRP